MAIVPTASKTYLGGNADAEATARLQYESARATGTNAAAQYATGGSTQGLTTNLELARQRQVEADQRNQAVVGRVLGAGPATNQYIGRTQADTMAAAEVQRQAALANTAAAQSIGGIAGARAAAGANANAAIEASRVQALTAAQERGQMASAQNQLNALNLQQAQGQAQFAQSSQGQALEIMRLQQQQAQQQAQAGLGLSGQYVQGQLGQEGQIAQNQQQYFQNQMASLQAKQAIAGQVMQGASMAAGAFGV